MLRRCICAENRKLHASPIWLMFLILPIISAGYGTFNYLQNLEILTDGWYSLWSQHTLFSSMFFLPALLGVFCAWQWRLEHTGHNWNRFMTAPVDIECLYLAKLIVAAGVSVLAQACIGALFLLGGTLAGLEGPFPRELQNVHADGTGFEREQGYKYPHNFPGHWVKQQYLPDDLKNAKYYSYGDNKTEQAARRYWEEIKK